MGTTVIAASQLLDEDGTPINGGMVYFGSNYQTSLEINNGACNGTVPSGTYDSIAINGANDNVVELGTTTLPDGGTFNLDQASNGVWCVRVANTYVGLLGSINNLTFTDLILAGAEVYLPSGPNKDQKITIINTSASSIDVWAPVGIGNTSVPSVTQLTIGALAALTVRFDGSYWRIVALSNVTQ